MEQEARPSSEESNNMDELEHRAVEKARDRAHDVVKIVAAIGALLLSIGFAYGNLTDKTNEFDNRLKAVEEVSKERDARLQKDLDDIKTQLRSIEGYLRNGSNRPDNPAGGGK